MALSLGFGSSGDSSEMNFDGIHYYDDRSRRFPGRSVGPLTGPKVRAHALGFMPAHRSFIAMSGCCPRLTQIPDGSVVNRMVKPGARVSIRLSRLSAGNAKAAVWLRLKNLRR